MDYAAKISELQRRQGEIDARLAAIVKRKREFALGAVSGQKASAVAIKELDREAIELRTERETVDAAIDQAAKLKAEQEAAIAAEDRRRREVEARAIAKEILGTDAEIDTALAALRELLVKRDRQIQALAARSVVHGALTSALRKPWRLTAAARKAALQRFINIEHVSPGHVATLEKLDSTALGTDAFEARGPSLATIEHDGDDDSEEEIAA
jgi:hypothetical protein